MAVAELSPAKRRRDRANDGGGGLRGGGEGGVYSVQHCKQPFAFGGALLSQEQDLGVGLPRAMMMMDASA